MRPLLNFDLISCRRNISSFAGVGVSGLDGVGMDGQLYFNRSNTWYTLPSTDTFTFLTPGVGAYSSIGFLYNQDWVLDKAGQLVEFNAN